MSEYFQNTAWLKQRLGRFTASEIHRLFTGGKRPMTEDELKTEKANKGKRTTVDTLFGDGAYTYIREKAAELLTMIVKDTVEFKQAEWGFMHEADAVKYFQKISGKEFTYYGCANPKFFNYGEYAGCSPDFENAEEGGDVKCPYNTAEHIKNQLLANQEQFKQVRWEYYCQAQMNMKIRGWKRFHFISYDPRLVEEKYRLKHLILLPDEEWAMEWEVRLNAAIEELNALLETLDTPSLLLASHDKDNDLIIVEKG